MMKKNYFILLIVIAIIGLALSNNNSITTQTKNIHLTQLQELIEHLSAFKNTLNQNKNKQVKAFTQVRTSYKTNEALLAYISPETNKFFINGAPLPRIDKNSSHMAVLAPQGLQIIEELLYTEEDNTTEITQKIDLLNTQLITLKKYHAQLKISDREIIEAVRFEVLRIATMGITGFDTPGSSNAIKESQEALIASEQLLQPYFKQNKTKAKHLELAFNNAVTYIANNTDFDSFNRFEFIQQHLSPIYGLILDFQLSLGIETIYEVNQGQYAINYNAKKIFDDQFYNKSFFTQYISKFQTKNVENLGKTLFFDPILSNNNERACASCHNPNQGFTDGLAKSLAFDKKGNLDRNSPTILNAVFAERFFHDMRSEKMEKQFEHVIVSDKEFNTSYQEILDKLNSSEEYKNNFKNAFPEYGNTITKYTFSTALAVYCASLSGMKSPFDNYINQKAEAPKNVINGFNLFMGKAACATCHFPPSFSGLVPPQYIESESEVIGVPLTTDTINPKIDNDMGRYTNGRPKERAPFFKNSFKTPTVRNIELTAPYMHNGVYQTLEEVVDFYNKGGGEGLGFSVPNQTLPFDNLQLNQQEVADLVSFLKTLNDTTGLTKTPKSLPSFKDKKLDNRKIGGLY